MFLYPSGKKTTFQWTWIFHGENRISPGFGNGNDAFIYHDYRIDYEEETRIPERKDTQMKPQIDQDGKQF